MILQMEISQARGNCGNFIWKDSCWCPNGISISEKLFMDHSFVKPHRACSNNVMLLHGGNDTSLVLAIVDRNKFMLLTS